MRENSITWFHSTFKNEPVTTILLIKPSSCDEEAIKKYYTNKLQTSLIVMCVEYLNGKFSKKVAKEWKEEFDRLLDKNNTKDFKYIYVADAEYFKLLTNSKKALPHLGEGFSYKGRKLVLGVNYSGLVYNPENRENLERSIETLLAIQEGSYTPIGENIIHSFSTEADYPLLVSKDVLFVDIETTSLKFYEAMIVSIAFAWDKHNGIAFKNPNIAHLRDFFSTYKGKIVFHNASYDLKVLLYVLFMKHTKDFEGMLYGLNVLFNNFDCTMLRSYLCLNSTSRPSYSLKDLAQEYVGSYAIDVSDVSSIPEEDLLRYNLIDTLATAYVYEKHIPDDPTLHQMYLDAQKVLTYTELCGMPINPEKVKEAKKYLEDSLVEQIDIINSFPEVDDVTDALRNQEMEKRNAKLKRKVTTIDEYEHITYNPNSSHHMCILFYDRLKLAVVARTPKGQPSTDTSTLKALAKHTDEYKELVEAHITYSAIKIIMSTFIPALEGAIKTPEGYYMYGNFKLNGTLSGRLSSVAPNLQNLPSNSTYGKLIKECFDPLDDFIFCGADFSALEDVINTLLTKDPNKEKIILDGYDSHSYKTFNYWRDKMPDLQLTEEDMYEIDGEFYKADDIVMDGLTALQIYERVGETKE